MVHKEVNLSLGVAINKVGSCALFFENFEVISWYSSAEDRTNLINVNECRKNKYTFDEKNLRFTYRRCRY